MLVPAAGWRPSARRWCGGATRNLTPPWALSTTTWAPYTGATKLLGGHNCCVLTVVTYCLSIQTFCCVTSCMVRCAPSRRTVDAVQLYNSRTPCVRRQLTGGQGDAHISYCQDPALCFLSGTTLHIRCCPVLEVQHGIRAAAR